MPKVGKMEMLWASGTERFSELDELLSNLLPPPEEQTVADAGRNGYGPNMTVKEQVILAIERLPEDADFKDVKDEIAFLAALREAEDDIAAGRTVTNEEMRRRIGSWTGA
jgi:hypothetical protein